MVSRKAVSFVRNVYRYFLDEGDRDSWKLFMQVISKLNEVKDR